MRIPSLFQLLKLLFTLVVFAPTLLTTRLLALDWASFVQCVGPSGTGSTCLLDPNPNGYTLSSKLTISRSYITVMGTAVFSRSDTTLRRGSTDLYHMIELATGVTNVRIRDLTLDGNRCLWGGCSLPIGGCPGQSANCFIDLDMSDWSNTTRSLSTESIF